jgi:hypothetical protein
MEFEHILMLRRDLHRGLCRDLYRSPSLARVTLSPPQLGAP